MTVGIVHYGLGPIGLAVAATVMQRPSLRSIAAIDANPELWGQDLGLLCGSHPAGVHVGPADETQLPPRAGVALHCTGSSLAIVAPQLHSLVNQGLSVISTCEELSYPWFEDGDIARELDLAARRADVAVLGTGVNPGFAMDYLPLVLTSVADRVRAVRVHRVQNASHRRLQLQHKVGAGLSATEFDTLRASGALGHVGLRQSAQAVAAALGWELDHLEETLSPALATTSVRGTNGTLGAGDVVGIDHTVVGSIDGREAVRLRLEMALGRTDARDVVDIEATPPVKVEVPGGLHGDHATAAIVVNAIPGLLQARSGLRTMAELPPPCPFE